jgi:hypothetical protein
MPVVEDRECAVAGRFDDASATAGDDLPRDLIRLIPRDQWLLNIEEFGSLLDAPL